MLGNNPIASGTAGTFATSSAASPSTTTQSNDEATASQGRLPDGSVIALATSPQASAGAADLAGALFTPAASLADPAPPSPLAAIKATSEFQQLRSRLAEHTANIKKEAQYRPKRAGDRYEWLQPELRTVWPRKQLWFQGTWLNGNSISVQGRPVAIATQHPLPGESLDAFLKQLLCDCPPLIVVLGSDAEIANPKEQMPDYFRPSNARADLEYIPPEGRRLQPVDNDVLGSYLVEGGMYVGESWLVVVQGIKPMSPLTEPGLGSISTGVIRVRERPANPMRHGEPRSHELEVVHLRATNKDGVMSAAELAWLGAKVTAARRASNALPILHCNSGAGRSALVIAASVLGDPTSAASVETVVRDIRRSRHWWALRSEDHIACLALFAQERGKPLLGAAPAVPLEPPPEPDPFGSVSKMATDGCRTQ